MKNVTLLAINAKYSHTNLAVRLLKKFADGTANISIAEHSINESVDKVLQSVISTAPDVVGISCYIWNINIALKVASSIKRVLENTVIFLGGPETSFHCRNLLASHPYVDFVISGEGERPFHDYLAGSPLSAIAGATYRDGGDIHSNPPKINPVPLDEIGFLYEDIENYKNRVIYFETSRGCPFNCTYCMSGVCGEMSYLSLPRVFEAFRFFMESNCMKIKLVDRTFNYPTDRFIRILEQLKKLKSELPNSKTCFHFEISANLLDERCITLLNSLDPGLVQLEIGVQSTNKQTLAAINRGHDVPKTLECSQSILNGGNIHLHLDLIAGLPYEGIAEFKTSFNEVYRVKPHMLQLGFLKVLKGSQIESEAEQYGIKYTSYAPYTVLCTNWLSYSELSALHRIESLVDTFYNSGVFKHTISYLDSEFNSPFDFYERLSNFAEQKGFFDRSFGLADKFKLLLDFSASADEAVLGHVKNLLCMDWHLCGSKATCPTEFMPEYSSEQRQYIKDFLGSENEYISDFEVLGHSKVRSKYKLLIFDSEVIENELLPQKVLIVSGREIKIVH